MGQSVCPLRDVEVRAITYRCGFRRRRFAGHLEYRLLATRGHAFGSFWIEFAKRDGLSGHHPLCKARTKEALMVGLRAEAAALGNVTSFVEVNHA